MAATTTNKEQMMALRRFVIEREIPAIGTFEREQLRAAAAKSNEVLRKLGPDIQWVESFVAGDRTFCIYLAGSEDLIRQHSEIADFPQIASSKCRGSSIRRRPARPNGDNRLSRASSP